MKYSSSSLVELECSSFIAFHSTADKIPFLFFHFTRKTLLALCLALTRFLWLEEWQCVWFSCQLENSSFECSPVLCCSELGLLRVCGTLSNCVPLYVKEFEKSFGFEDLHSKIFWGFFSIIISEISRLLLFLVCKGTNHKCNDTYLKMLFD